MTRNDLETSRFFVKFVHSCFNISTFAKIVSGTEILDNSINARDNLD